MMIRQAAMAVLARRRLDLDPPDAEIDLSDADLDKVDLTCWQKSNTKIVIAGAKLTGAKLSRAFVDGAFVPLEGKMAWVNDATSSAELRDLLCARGFAVVSEEQPGAG